MNCTRCGMPLEKNARFCRNCGQPVATANPQEPGQQVDSVVREDSPTKPVEPVQVLPPPSTPPTQSSQPEQVWLRSPSTPQSQASYFQPTQYVTHRNAPAEPPLAAATIYSTRPRRRRGGCLIGCLVTLLILAILLLGGWIFALRPYLHTLAQNQINLALADAVNQIPPPAALSPAGTVIVDENAVNNLIVLNSAPSDLVQNVHMLITPNNVELDFQVQVSLGTQVLSYPGSFTAIPQVNNGQLIVTQVQVSPILGLVMSPDELTTIINSHLADAQARYRHPIKSILLKNHELDLTVGPPTL
jgi:hypothetical protein